MVELITSAVVLGVAFAAIFGTVRYMRGEQMADYHRRQSRAAINRLFDGAFSTYVSHPGQYSVPYGLIVPSDAPKSDIADDTLKFSIAPGAGGIGGDPVLESVTSQVQDLPAICLDCREGYERIDAYWGIDVGSSPEKIGSKEINTHIVQITLSWKSGGKDEALTLTKRLVPKSWN